MYLSHNSLVRDFESDKISAQDVFFYVNRLSRGERKKFINKARDLLIIR
ncbi:hypothetical protein HOF92_04210 [bacterium]|jgi:hypothetical protein|nr:hypothetical protein [bacterium]